MRVRRWYILCAALAGTAWQAGCRAIEGIDGLPFAGGAGGACAPWCGGLPAGWSGPVAVYEGAPGTAPECPSDYPIPVLDGGIGLDAPPAICSACSCGAPSGSCTPGQVEVHSHSSCNGASDTLTPPAGMCTKYLGTNVYFVETPAQVNGGACPPNGGVASVPPVSWMTEGVACGLPAGTTCAGSSPCAPQPAAPFDARWCIFQTGKHSCPSAFPQQHLWETVSDGRVCSPCVCNPPATCVETTALFSDSSCSTQASPVDKITTTDQCTQQSGVQSVLVTVNGLPSCTPSGGTPMGAATAQPTATVCCAD